MKIINLFFLPPLTDKIRLKDKNHHFEWAKLYKTSLLIFSTNIVFNIKKSSKLIKRKLKNSINTITNIKVWIHSKTKKKFN